jgi:hypothetical protein
MSKPLTDNDFVALSDDDFLTDDDFKEQPKKKTSFTEDIGIGLTNLGHSGKTVLDILAGAAASKFGKEGEADKIYADMEARLKARDAEMKSLDQGLAGKVTSGAAQVLPAFALGPMMGLTASVGGLSGMGALENTVEDIRAGERFTPMGAAAKTAADTGVNFATTMLPVGKGLIGGAKWGAGGNVAGQAGTDIIGNLATSGEANKRYDFDPENYAVQAVTGGVVGGTVGKFTGSDTPSTPKPGDEKVKPTPQSEAEADIKRQADFRIEKAGKEVDKLTLSKLNIEEKISKITDRINKNGGASTLAEQEQLAKLQDTLGIVEQKLEKETKLLKDSLDIRGKYGDDIPTVTERVEPTLTEEVPTVKQIEPSETREVDAGGTVPIDTGVPTRDTGQSLYDASRPRAERRSIEQAFRENEVDPTTKAIQEELAWQQRDNLPEQGFADNMYERQEGMNEVTDDLLKGFDENQWKLEQKLHTESDLTQGDQNFQKVLDDMKSAVGDVLTALAEKSGGKMNFNPGEGLGKAMSNLADALYRAGHTTYLKAVAAAKAQLGNAWDRVKEFFRQAWDHNRNQASNPVVKNVPGLNKTFDNVNKVIDFDTVKNMVMNNQMGDPPSSILRKIGLNYFGDQQFIPMIKNSMPYVYNAYKVIKATGDTSIRMARTWLNDFDSTKVDALGKGFWNKLTAYKNPDSVNETWHKGSWQDVETIYGMFKKAFDADMTLRDYYNQNHTQLSEMQRKMYESAMKMFEKMHMETGIKSYRKGWFPILRRGDFLVTVRDEKDTPFHIETFRTSEEARIFERQVAESTNYTTNMVDKKSNPSLFDHLNGIGEMFGKNPTPEQIEAMRVIDEVRQRMAENAGLGGHDKHRLGFSGFEGNRWFKTREQNAEDFRKAVFDSASEYSSLYRKRMLSTLAEGFVRDPDIASKIPLQVEFTDHLFRNAMNEMDGFGTMTIDGKKVSLDREFKGWLDNNVVKAIDQFNKKFGTDLPMPKHSLLDRSHGIAAQLFYISALTTRPAFWAAQILTAPFSLRGLLQEGSMVDVANATCKGMWNVLTGGDQQFRNFIKDVANTTDSLHPQFMNDINSIGRQWLADGKHATIKGIFEWGTGQAPGAIADSISRYITMSIGYEFYKPLIKNQQQLRNQVTAFSDATMVMYSREHVAPMMQKLGTVGELMAPLTKYPTAQLGNLINDLKLIKDKKTFQSTLPAMSTLLTSMIMGGTMGTVLVAEYELLRSVITALADQFGLTDEAEEVLPPSAEKAILENTFLMQKALADSYGLIPGVDQERAKRMAQFGIVSGLAGFDIGSGLRFQGFTPDLLQDPNKGIFSLMPAVAFAKQAIQAGLTELKPENTLAEDRKTWMGVQPFVGAKALVDRTMFDAGTRKYVPDTRYDAQVPQTVKEEVGTLIGSRPTETVQETKRLFFLNKEDQKLKTRFERKLTLAADKITRGEQIDKESLRELAEFGLSKLGKTPDSALNSIETILKKRNIPANIRYQLGTDLEASMEDIVKIKRYQATR